MPNTESSAGPRVHSTTMWCTRWFLPLLLLPLPTAPPYFLVLFLFSLTMHAKPCFYCIVLLTTLFVSSCYWQPFPIDSPLTVPWSHNITTFSEALNSTLIPNYAYALPTVMRAVDRCWCDFSMGGFWEPFNVSQWEYLSIQRVRHELERQQKNTDAVLAANITQISLSANDSMSVPLNQTLLNLSNATVSTPTFWSRLRNFPRGSQHALTAETQEKDSSLVVEVQNITSAPPSNLPLIRQEYDLRPYGIGLVVDLGWSP